MLLFLKSKHCLEEVLLNSEEKAREGEQWASEKKHRKKKEWKNDKAHMETDWKRKKDSLQANVYYLKCSLLVAVI